MCETSPETLAYRAFRLGANGIHRNQHGIDFRRKSGQTYSARNPQGSASTRNLGIREGAFDREAAAIAGAAAQAIGFTPRPTASMLRPS